MTVMAFSPEADLLIARTEADAVLAIRREDKGPSERRAPLAPKQIASLAGAAGLKFAIESSDRRVFTNRDYAEAGATVVPSLCRPPVILGVKEPDPERLVPGATYLVFAHVTKGQPSNMPLLRRMQKLGCTLIDYEQIVDEAGRRLVFFGRHAGHAGAINALWALGQRYLAEGTSTPFAEMKLAHEYTSLDAALAQVRAIGARIRTEGLPATLRPVIFAIAGSGHVSEGAEAVLEDLQPREIGARELQEFSATREVRHEVFLARLSRAARYHRIGGGAFDAADYARHPHRFTSALERYLKHVTVFVNGTYWHDGLPRLIDNEQLDELWRAEAQPVLRVIADITCDVGGSIEANVAATNPEAPVYVYTPVSRREDRMILPGVHGEGPVLMTVDNLPAQMPREASESFGDQLLPFIPELAACDWTRPLNRLSIGPELRRATIVHRGTLTPRFAHLHEAMNRAGA